MPETHFETRRGEYCISTDPVRLDPVAVHAYLTRSYWSPGIPLEIVERALRNSMCVGLYHEVKPEPAPSSSSLHPHPALSQGERVPGANQVGLARVVTDRATYAYLCDVYVLEEHRGHEQGKWLMHAVMSHPDLQGLRRFTLATRDAHGLYRQFGFEPLADPSRHMEITVRNIYLQNMPAPSDEQLGTT